MGQPVPGQEPPRFEARLYDVLFRSQNLAAAVGAEARLGLLSCMRMHVCVQQPCSAAGTLQRLCAGALPGAAWLVAAAARRPGTHSDCVHRCAPLPVQDDWLEDLNEESLTVVKGAYATPELAKAQPGDRWVLGGHGCARHARTARCGECGGMRPGCAAHAERLRLGL